jgi:hypothetical protein
MRKRLEKFESNSASLEAEVGMIKDLNEEEAREV